MPRASCRVHHLCCLQVIMPLFFETSCVVFHPVVCVLQRDTKKGEGWKMEERKQETKRHTHGADPATQADTEKPEAENAVLEHAPTEIEKKQQPHTAETRTNHAPKATRTDTKRKHAPAAQDRETSRREERAPRAGTPRRRQGNPGARTCHPVVPLHGFICNMSLLQELYLIPVPYFLFKTANPLPSAQARRNCAWLYVHHDGHDSCAETFHLQ
jgi:hypothetical protein